MIQCPGIQICNFLNNPINIHRILQVKNIWYLLLGSNNHKHYIARRVELNFKI